MVRLKESKDERSGALRFLFQFHNGSIKSGQGLNIENIFTGFNSTMVRLKVAARHVDRI